jgi:hypothetical protein
MSSINPNNIDGTYPIAGQDNDSQGFRDNFTNVKNNLTFAKSEIEDLQKNVLLKVGLAGTTLDNEMSNAQLKGVQALRFTETIKDLGALSGTVTVDWQDAHYQILETTDDVTLDFTGWPTSGFYTKLRLEIIITDVTDTVTLPAEVSSGLSTTLGSNGQVLNYPATGSYVYEFTTYDNGATITIQELTRNRKNSTEVAGYQYIMPANTNVAVISAGVSTVILDPTSNLISLVSATIASANIAMPGNTRVSDGQTISLAFGNTITSVTHFGNGATIKGSLTTATTSTAAKYIFKTSTNTWYRLG